MRHQTLITALIYLTQMACNHSERVAQKLNDTTHMSNQGDTPKRKLNKDTIDTEFLSFWKMFVNAVKTSNLNTFKRFSFDSLNTCDTTIAVNVFANKCIAEVFDKKLLDRISDSSKINFLDIKEQEANYFPKYVRQQLKNISETFKIKQVQILKVDTYIEGPWTMTFDFLETKYGYKFLGCDSFGGPICCR